MRKKALLVVGILSFFLVLGCDSEDEAGGTPCSGQSDCGAESACVSANATTVCQLNCSLDANLCGAEASCTGVGASTMSVNVCQPAPEPEEEPVPEEQPSLPCSIDEDCQKFSSIAICAQYDGVRDCTIPCAQESDCDMPTVMGVNVDFMTCIPDEGDTTRMACLPDEACFADPMSCMSGIDDFLNMGNDLGMDDDDMDDGDDMDFDESFDGDFDF